MQTHTPFSFQSSPCASLHIWLRRLVFEGLLGVDFAPEQGKRVSNSHPDFWDRIQQRKSAGGEEVNQNLYEEIWPVYSFSSLDPSYIWAFLFSCYLPCFPAILSFPWNPAFSGGAQRRTAFVSTFLHLERVQSRFAFGIPSFAFPAVGRICKALLRHHLSNPASLPCPDFTPVCGGQEYESVEDLGSWSPGQVPDPETK